MKKPIEIFKPGKHTAMSGAVIDFTEADLKATAEAYDPKLHEAPFVIGHPKLDAPAYGWAKSLAYGGVLQAEPDQVDPAFAEMVNQGRFKKVSASFFAPDSPNNPKPGVYYLRHVGFLGAQPPAVKGLKSASFAGAEEGVIEFADWTDVTHVRVLRRLRDWLIAKFGADEADKALSGYELDSLHEAAAASVKTNSAPSYAEPTPTQEPTMKPDEIAAKEADLKKQQEDLDRKNVAFSEREKKIKDQEAQAKRADIVAFAEGLVKQGKLLPRDQAGLVEYMAADGQDDVIEFAEGDEKKKVPRGQWLRELLGSLPQQVDYAERTKPGEGGDKTVSFAAPQGYGVDPARLELHNKAIAWRSQHPDTDYDAAIRAVSN